jgi:hypothetical protein
MGCVVLGSFAGMNASGWRFIRGSILYNNIVFINNCSAQVPCSSFKTED